MEIMTKTIVVKKRALTEEKHEDEMIETKQKENEGS